MPLLAEDNADFGLTKSQLQIKLESYGYRFLTNMSLVAGYEIDPERDENGYYNYKKLAYKTREIPFTDSELAEKVRDLGRFSEIRLEEAFDVSGKRLSNYKAVYVKDKKPSEY